MLPAGSSSGSGVEAPAENFFLAGSEGGRWARWVGLCDGGGVAAAVAAAGENFFRAGRGGRRSEDRGDSSGAVRGGSSVSVHRQSVPPLRVNRDRYPQELQFLDKVVDEPVLCNDSCSKGFAHRHGRRRASGHASVHGDF